MVMGRDYHRPYAIKWYHARRSEYLSMLGGKCADCGDTENLQFDHIDWRTKSFPLGKLMSVSQDRAKEELKKCQILCQPCHVIKTRQDMIERKLRMGEPGGLPAPP